LLGGKFIFSFIASSAGHKDIVEVLLSKSNDVNIKDYSGRTPIHEGELISHISNSS
jgi:ankyrin repeat protein